MLLIQLMKFVLEVCTIVVCHASSCMHMLSLYLNYNLAIFVGWYVVGFREFVM